VTSAERPRGKVENKGKYALGRPRSGHIRRSLSRGARARDDGHHRHDHERQRDRSGNRDGERTGGRRRASSATPVLLRPSPASSPAQLGSGVPNASEAILPLEAAATPPLTDEPAAATAEPVLDLVLASDALPPPTRPAPQAQLGMPRDLNLTLPHPSMEPSINAAADADRVDRAMGLLLPSSPRHATGLGRGRARVRSASPRATRRRSRAARTPPNTPDPPSSPTAVCPSSPSSKGSCLPSRCSRTTRMARPDASASRPSLLPPQVRAFFAPCS
jgi:hypothetical protein